MMVTQELMQFLVITKWNIKNGLNLALDQVDQNKFILVIQTSFTKTTKDGAKDRLPNGNYILTVHQNYVLILGE